MYNLCKNHEGARKKITYHQGKRVYARRIGIPWRSDTYVDIRRQRQTRPNPLPPQRNIKQGVELLQGTLCCLPLSFLELKFGDCSVSFGRFRFSYHASTIPRAPTPRSIIKIERCIWVNTYYPKLQANTSEQRNIFVLSALLW